MVFITLAVAGNVSSTIAVYGINVLFKAAITKYYKQNDTEEGLKSKIHKGP